MGLRDSDLILVERSNTLKKVTYGDRANIASSDLFLVERGGTLYKCTYANWSSANSTDLILVEANSTTNGRVVGKLYNETQSAWAFSTANVDIHSANHEIGPLTLLYGEDRNNTNPFSVAEVQVEVTSSASYADGDLYIGFRNTAPTDWMGDLPIAAVQILHADGSTVRVTGYHSCTWNFALGNTQARYRDWATTRSQDTRTNMNYDPADAVGGYYGCTGDPVINCIATCNTCKWQFAYTQNRGATGSQWVGAQRGISSSTYTGNPSTTSILPVGTANVSQSSSTSDGYLYSECSGSDTNDVTWLALYATGNIYNGDRIRICYFGGGNGQYSSTGLQEDGSLYLRFIEDESS